MIKLQSQLELVSPKDTVVIEDKVFDSNQRVLIFYRSLKSKSNKLVAIEQDKLLSRINRKHRIR